jgi:hypothetical protein
MRVEAYSHEGEKEEEAERKKERERRERKKREKERKREKRKRAPSKEWTPENHSFPRDSLHRFVERMGHWRKKTPIPRFQRSKEIDPGLRLQPLRPGKKKKPLPCPIL